MRLSSGASSPTSLASPSRHRGLGRLRKSLGAGAPPSWLERDSLPLGKFRSRRWRGEAADARGAVANSHISCGILPRQILLLWQMTASKRLVVVARALLGSFVKISTGELGVVIRVDREQLLAPVVLVLFDKNGKRLSAPRKVDLWEEQQLKSTKQVKIELSMNPKAFNVDINDYIQRRF